jgi:rhodanese-related sulfurtransferase
VINRLLFVLVMFALLLATGTWPAHAQTPGTAHEAVSAQAAAQAIARGAVVVDVRQPARYQEGHLPGAVSLPADAWGADIASLGQQLSAAGIDLSREVLLVGLPGDPLAQQLQFRLAGYATGRVLWLVGGVTEWQMTGRAVETVGAAARLLPVPQHLVALHGSALQARMAGAARRDIQPYAQAQTKWAARVE